MPVAAEQDDGAGRGAEGAGSPLTAIPGRADELADLLARRARHADRRRRHRCRPVGHQAASRARPDRLHRRHRRPAGRSRTDRTRSTLGAAVRYSDARAALARLHPDLGELVRRIGGVQVRNAGTIGGNIANGSPIGDMPPALIALGAELTLRRGRRAPRRCRSRISSSATASRTARPASSSKASASRAPPRDMLIRIVKLSKRFDSDISGVCGAFALRIEDGVVREARIAFGGMAGIPARAPGCEAALTGAAWTAETVEAAAEALARDYDPLDDLRGSAAYRRTAAANLLRRLWAGAAASPSACSMAEGAVHQPLPHDSADLPCRRRGALCRRSARAAGPASPRLRPRRRRPCHACCRSISTRCAPRPASSRSSPPPTSPARTMSARSSTTTGCSPRARSSIPASRCSSSPRPAPAPRAAPPGSARSRSSRCPRSSPSPRRRRPAR